MVFRASGKWPSNRCDTRGRDIGVTQQELRDNKLVVEYSKRLNLPH